MKRRDFLKTAAAGATMLSCFPATLSAIERTSTDGKIEKRALGKTGEMLSAMGFGGLVLKGRTPSAAEAMVRRAVEAGVTYFDVAPKYGDAEERMGPALEPFRQDVFLSCKTAQRTRQGALEELDRSLQRLRADHFDLYQLHHVTRMREVDTIFGEDGAIEALQQARQDGKTRFLGFSAHSVEAAMALMERFDFDTIMFPVHYASWHAGNFGPQVLEKAQKKNMGIIALKAMAKRPWPEGADRSSAPNCWYEPFLQKTGAMTGIRFTLSHPVTAFLQPASTTCLELGLKLTPEFTPLDADEVDEIKRKAMSEPPIFRYPRRQRAALGREMGCDGMMDA